MPRRVQMTRSKPWRKDYPDAVIVARPSKWGNPFRVGDRVITAKGGYKKIRDRAQAVELFRRRFERWRGSYSAEIIHELRGKDLACWCPLDQPCHADVLLEIANRPIKAVAPNTTEEG